MCCRYIADKICPIADDKPTATARNRIQKLRTIFFIDVNTFLPDRWTRLKGFHVVRGKTYAERLPRRRRSDRNGTGYDTAIVAYRMTGRRGVEKQTESVPERMIISERQISRKAVGQPHNSGTSLCVVGVGGVERYYGNRLLRLIAVSGAARQNGSAACCGDGRGRVRYRFSPELITVTFRSRKPIVSIANTATVWFCNGRPVSPGSIVYGVSRCARNVRYQRYGHWNSPYSRDRTYYLERCTFKKKKKTLLRSSFGPGLDEFEENIFDKHLYNNNNDF